MGNKPSSTRKKALLYAASQIGSLSVLSALVFRTCIPQSEHVYYISGHTIVMGFLWFFAVMLVINGIVRTAERANIAMMWHLLGEGKADNPQSMLASVIKAESKMRSTHIYMLPAGTTLVLDYIFAGVMLAGGHLVVAIVWLIGSAIEYATEKKYRPGVKQWINMVMPEKAVSAPTEEVAQ